MHECEEERWSGDSDLCWIRRVCACMMDLGVIIGQLQQVQYQLMKTWRCFEVIYQVALPRGDGCVVQET